MKLMILFDKLKKVMNTFGTYFIFDAINKALPFVLLPIIAKYLTTEEFGVVTNYLAVYQIAYIFISYSTYTRLSVDYYMDDINHKFLFTNLVFLMAIITIVVSLVIVAFNSVIEDFICISLSWQILAILAAFFASVGNLFTTLLVLQKKSLLYGIVQNVQSLVLFLFCLLLVVVIPLNWKGRVIAQVISCLLIFIFTIIYAGKHNLIKKKETNITYLKEYFLWGIPLLPHTLSFWFKSGFDKVIVTSYLGLAMNGVYSLSLTLGSVMSLITTSFFNVYTPHLFEKLASYDKMDKDDGKSILNKLLKSSFLFVGGYALIVIVAYYALKILIYKFFSGDYQDAIEFLPYVLFVNFLNAIYTIASGFLFYKKKNVKIGSITFLSSLIQMGLNIMLVNYFGIYGILWSGIVSAAFMAIFVVYFSFKEYK